MPTTSQRLILRYSVGDGCTYSSEVTLPVVFASKQALVEHLTQAIQAYAQELAAYLKERGAKYQALREQVQQQQRASGRKRDSALSQTLQAQWLEATNALAAVQAPEHRFVLGPHELNLEDFIDRSSSEVPTPVLPSVFTLDEFFEEAEALA